jgi:single-strand DNA-binding protein
LVASQFAVSRRKLTGEAMAEGLNRVMLLGNLGADPELRVTGGGQAILKLRLATTETYMDKSNTRQERTEWHSVTLFGKRAEALGKMLTKGERVFVEGRLETSSYEKDGEKRYRTEVVASNIVLNGRGAGNTNEDRPAPRARHRGAHIANGASSDLTAFGGGDDSIPF